MNKKLLESTNPEDVFLGMCLFYKEYGKEYFVDKMKYKVEKIGKISYQIDTPFNVNCEPILIVTPEKIVIHFFRTNHWVFAEYLSEIEEIKPPKYLQWRVFQM